MWLPGLMTCFRPLTLMTSGVQNEKPNEASAFRSVFQTGRAGRVFLAYNFSPVS
jgi:hypothetical protein